MAKNKAVFEENKEEDRFREDGKPVEAAQEPVGKDTVHHYRKLRWKGIMDTFKCLSCKVSLEQEGDMILHVVKHVPEEEREALLKELINNKEK